MDQTSQPNAQSVNVPPVTQAPANQTLVQTPPPQPPGYRQAQTQQVTADEIIKKPKPDLYSSSYTSIIFRNFLAGFARTLGGIIVYFIFLLILARLFATYVLPEIEPLITTLEQLVELQTTMSDPGNIQIDPGLIDQVLQQMSQ